MDPIVISDLIEDRTVLRLMLNRPKGNILDAAMMHALSDSLAAHQDQKNLRLVLLRGTGSQFSYGASVQEHQKDQAPSMLASFHKLVRQVAAFPLPVAVLVEGACLGGAFELALSCHLIFASPSASFGCPEIKLGVFPPVLAAIGPIRMGGLMAERMTLTGCTIDAAEAEKAGLVSAVLNGEQDPEAQVLEWYLRNLAPLSAFALRQATKACRESSPLLRALGAVLDRIERQYIQEVLPSHDGNEGIASFLERRKPVWEDR